MSGAATRAAVAQSAPSISQTSFVFGALAVAFLFFITIRGDLPKWLGMLGLAGTPATPGAANAVAPPNLLGGSAASPPALPSLTPGATPGVTDFFGPNAPALSGASESQLSGFGSGNSLTGASQVIDVFGPQEE